MDYCVCVCVFSQDFPGIANHKLPESEQFSNCYIKKGKNTWPCCETYLAELPFGFKSRKSGTQYQALFIKTHTQKLKEEISGLSQDDWLRYADAENCVLFLKHMCVSYDLNIFKTAPKCMVLCPLDPDPIPGI